MNGFLLESIIVRRERLPFMANKKLKFGFRNLSALETVALCERTVQSLAQLPPEHLHDVKQAEFAATTAAARASLLRVDELRSALKAEVSRRNTLVKKAREQMTYAAGMAALNMNGDAVKMLSLGLPLAAPKAPAHVPAAPESLRAVPTASAGEAELRWVRPMLRCMFEVQAQAAPLHEDGWKYVNTCSRQKVRVQGLTSGDLYWFRVRAFNARGHGPWSQLASARIK